MCIDIDKMPSPSYAQNKKHFYKWRENHIEKSREYNRKYIFKRRFFEREAKLFLNILLD